VIGIVVSQQCCDIEKDLNSIGSLAKADRTEEDDIGEVIGLASNMFVFFNRSKI
jgi:hypothetical protein